MHSQLGYTKLGIFILIFHLHFIDQGKISFAMLLQNIECISQIDLAILCWMTKCLNSTKLREEL